MNPQNWIAGSGSAGAQRDVFEPFLRPGVDQPDRWWPRSEVEDLVRALDGLREEAAAWQGLGLERRRARLGDLLDRWQARAPGVDDLALRLDLGAEGLDEELEMALEAGDRCLAMSAGLEEARDSRVHVIRPQACESFQGLVERSFPALLSGRPLLVLSDPDLPWLAQEFVRNFSAEDDTATVVSLLHDDRSLCWSAILGSEAVHSAELPGVDRSRSKHEQDLAALGGAASTQRSRGFGAGVLPTPSPLPSGPQQVQFEGAKNSTALVFEDEDPEVAAERIYREAFDPRRAWSGQRAARVGRVLVHERLISAFTAALLDRIDDHGEEATCRHFSHDLEAYRERLLRLGLDEGATLICGGSTEGAGFRGRRQKGILTPSVFTNAEPTMGVVSAPRPAPVLSLMRVKSDAEAKALSETFAQSPNLQQDLR